MTRLFFFFFFFVENNKISHVTFPIKKLYKVYYTCICVSCMLKYTITSYTEGYVTVHAFSIFRIYPVYDINRSIHIQAMTKGRV